MPSGEGVSSSPVSSLYFRKSANLALAWEHRRAEYERFPGKFGAPWGVGTWDVIQDLWRDFTFAKVSEEFEGRGEQILSLPAELRDAETVGMIFDPDGGMYFPAGFGIFLAALNDPANSRKPTIHPTEPRCPGLLPLNCKQVDGPRYLRAQQALAETAEMSALARQFDSADLTRKGTRSTNATPRRAKRKRNLAKEARKRNRRWCIAHLSRRP